MENPNMTPEAMIGRIAALEWMVAQLYSMTVAMWSKDPDGFFEANREMLKERMPEWRLPSDISFDAATEVFDRIFSIGAQNAAKFSRSADGQDD